MKGGKVLDTSYTPDFRNPVPSPPLPWGYFANPPPAILSLSPQVAIAGAESHPVLSAAFSPDGARIVTASFDNTAGVWDAAPP